MTRQEKSCRSDEQARGRCSGARRGRPAWLSDLTLDQIAATPQLKHRQHNVELTGLRREAPGYSAGQGPYC